MNKIISLFSYLSSKMLRCFSISFLISLSSLYKLIWHKKTELSSVFPTVKSRQESYYGLKNTKKFIYFLALSFVYTKIIANDICPICYQTLSKAMINQKTCCGHEFHAVCLGRWLKNNHLCPACRGNMAFHTDKHQQTKHDMCETFFAVTLNSDTHTQLPSLTVFGGINLVSALEDVPESIQPQVNALTERERIELCQELHQQLSLLNLEGSTSDAILIILLMLIIAYFAEA